MTDGERDLVQFSRELDRVMKTKGWTQRQLADKADLSKGTVGNMLAGAREGVSPDGLIRPRRDQVLKLAAGLDESPVKWLRLAGHSVDDEVDEERALLERITRGAELLDAEDRRVFARMIEGYLIRGGHIAPPGATASGQTQPAGGAVGEPMGGGPRAGAPDIVDDTTLRDPLKESDEV